MAVIKQYDKSHHDSISSSRKRLREATNRVNGKVLTGATPKPAETPEPEQESE